MSQKKIYIAGPDVFMKNAKEIGECYKQICAVYGFTGLYPLDNEIASNGLPKPKLSAKIFEANCAQIRNADCVIANLNDFRGYGMDDGTAWEIGYASAIGKPIYGYMADTRSLRRRIGTKDKKGNLVEDFGHPVNLMIYESCVIVFQGDFESCIKAIAKQ